MEDVEIVDVDEDGVPQMEKVPENQDLSFLTETVGSYLAQYGWYLLVATALACVLIQQLSKRRARQAQRTTPPQTRQDPVVVARRQEALEAARRKMQEEHDAQAAIFREKQREQEEEKRRQKIEMWDSMRAGKSYHGNTRLSQATEEASSSTVLKPKTNKKPLRSSDYNPLAGDGGGSCSWRPGRRGPSSGG